TAAKFLESKGLNSSQELQDLIHCAESAVDTESDEDGKLVFNNGLASILLLLHLIPPSAQGRKRPGKISIHGYYIILDKKAIPCKSVSGLAAFDELFKAHFVFGAAYNKVLHNIQIHALEVIAS
ncbi:hypothetical protein M9458_056305, partial [Cirrhinus mrigala]